MPCGTSGSCAGSEPDGGVVKVLAVKAGLVAVPRSLGSEQLPETHLENSPVKLKLIRKS